MEALRSPESSPNLRKVTLAFPVKENEVLLAYKKRGFGVGKWNGVGGKCMENESIVDAMIRETQEEIGIIPVEYMKVAILNFYFPEVSPDKGLDQQASVYLILNWEGTIHESEEMFPQWFNIDRIPFSNMWADDNLWLPYVLKGKFVNADFYFDRDQNVRDSNIRF